MKKIVIVIILYLSLLILIFNTKTDVIKIYANKSLSDITTTFKSIVKEETTKSTLTVDQKNFLIINKNFKSKEDFILKLDATPFIEAGMKNSDLPTGYQLVDGYLISSTNFGESSGNNFTDSFFKAVDNNRGALAYHEDLDHFGLILNGNNKIEYAKDYQTNTLDIVFVLNANHFKNKGINLEKIEGWIFKTMVAKDGTKSDVLLKPYNLN